MIKCLWIGHLLENSGYSQASLDYVHALHSSGVDVVCRNIKLNNIQGETSDLVKELLRKPIEDVNVCIQHLLPHHYSYHAGMKNIGLFVYDTIPAPYEWVKSLQLMDEIFVPTNHVKKSIISRHLTKPVHIVPHACDITKFDKKYTQPFIPELSGTYKFYYIGEANRRKNISDIVKAFHCEFKRHEPVSLILKTSIPGMNADESARIISDECNKIKVETRLYPSVEQYKPEVIITNRVTDEQLNGIHQYSDCYISTSRGEGWCQPLFDSVGFNKQVIFYDSNKTSMYPYLRGENSGRISLDSEPCVGYNNAAFPFIGTARESWLKSDVSSLQHKMRLAYENRNVSRPKMNIDEYSYAAVGSLMKGLLSE